MAVKHTRGDFILYGVLLLVVAAQIGVWFMLRHDKATWTNVPPAPSAQVARMAMLGDAQLAYRAGGVFLQTMGDHGGNVTLLKDYNYHRLGRWFMTMHELDSRSNFMPLLAAYYYGATQDTSDLPPLIDYLAMVGESTQSGKWRWLAQAIYLARFQTGDLDKALQLSYKLAAMYNESMPAWVVQMPSFIMAQQGQREAAYDFAINILKSDAETMHPNEVRFMQEYICERILTPEEAEINPLCAD